MIAIYKLIDPRDNQVHYIGQAKNPENRLARHRKHLGCSVVIDNLKTAWTYELKGLGLAPLMEVIVWVDDNQADAVELATIAQYRNAGFDLYNTTGNTEGKNAIFARLQQKAFDTYLTNYTRLVPDTQVLLKDLYREYTEFWGRQVDNVPKIEKKKFIELLEIAGHFLDGKWVNGLEIARKVKPQ